jgi:hypothetical protein
MPPEMKCRPFRPSLIARGIATRMGRNAACSGLTKRRARCGHAARAQICLTGTKALLLSARRPRCPWPETKEETMRVLSQGVVAMHENGAYRPAKTTIRAGPTPPLPSLGALAQSLCEGAELGRKQIIAGHGRARAYAPRTKFWEWRPPPSGGGFFGCTKTGEFLCEHHAIRKGCKPTAMRQ